MAINIYTCQWIALNNTSRWVPYYTFMWTWKAFNPIWNPIYTDTDMWCTVIWSMSSLNISSYNAWTELFLFYIEFTTSYTNCRWQLLNPDWIVIWDSFNFPPYYWYENKNNIWQWWWIWLRHWEVDMNWTYTVRVEASWSYYYSYFTISWLTASQLTRYTSWHIWIEWDTIAYIDNCNEEDLWLVWYKHRIPNDWWNWWFIWTWSSWNIWIDTVVNWKIYFVDSSWYLRRTIQWDSFGSHNNNTEIPKTPWYQSAWSIWVSNWWYNIYLFFVWYDWKVYRISHATSL